jgi:putative ABC transport system ATP-binding protein
MNKPFLLEAQAVTKRYASGDVQALQEVSLSVAERESIAIMGPSGSGKSTLLHILSGLDLPTSGMVRFGGEPLPKLLRRDRFRLKNFGFVFQSFFLWPHLNVIENVTLPLIDISLSRREKIKRGEELIKSMGIWDKLKAPIGQLSMGQRQRVAIARALVTQPKIIFADEPTGNLDSQNARQILELLRKIKQERGMTTVMVTHEKIATDFSDRSIQILDGRIV